MTSSVGPDGLNYEQRVELILGIVTENPNVSIADLCKKTKIPESTVRRIWRNLVQDGRAQDKRRLWGGAYHTEEGIRAREEKNQLYIEQSTNPILPQAPSPKDLGYEEGDPWDRVRALEQELRETRSQMEYVAHHSIKSMRGGTFTLNISDLHLHDRGFLRLSFLSVRDKIIDSIKRFKPRRFLGVINGDTIPGVGVYRNQHMESILPGADQQIAAGVFKFINELDEPVKKAMGKGERSWTVIFGQHDFSQGDPTSMRFVASLRMFGVPVAYAGSEYIHNAADEGTYNIYFTHGYGGSSYAQTPPKLVMEVVLRALDSYVRGIPIHRISHGHLHWRTSDFYRGSVPWDTTGGFQRFERAGHGQNIRPVGCLIYISPPGRDDILKPIEIGPDDSALRGDMDDRMLENKNRDDAAKNLDGFHEMALELGIVEE